MCWDRRIVSTLTVPPPAAGVPRLSRRPPPPRPPGVDARPPPDGGGVAAAAPPPRAACEARVRVDGRGAEPLDRADGGADCALGGAHAVPPQPLSGMEKVAAFSTFFTVFCWVQQPPGGIWDPFRTHSCLLCKGKRPLRGAPKRSQACGPFFYRFLCFRNVCLSCFTVFCTVFQPLFTASCRFSFVFHCFLLVTSKHIMKKKPGTFCLQLMSQQHNRQD